MKFLKNKIQYIVEFISVIILVIADQLIKKSVVLNIKGQPPIILIKGVLCLQYLENRGAAFGMLQNRQIFFIIIGIVFVFASAYILMIIPCLKKYLALRISIICICAGAIGNLVDRIVQKYVVDFIYFEYIDFPIFNFADILVSVGCIVLVLLVLFYYKDDELDFKKAKEIKVHSSMVNEERKQ